MDIAFKSVAFGRVPGMPMKLAVPTWIIERHSSPEPHGTEGQPGDRYRR
jgi:hypothetical protein